MVKYINGVGAPKFIIRSGLTQIDSIELPLTQLPGGLKEKWLPVFKKHELWNNNINTDLRGWRVTFTFDYAGNLEKQDMLNIKKIVDYQKAGFNIELLPRNEYLNRYFPVFLTDNEIVIAIQIGGINAIGNKSVELEFMTRGLVSNFDVRDPDTAEWGVFFLYPRLCVLD